MIDERCKRLGGHCGCGCSFSTATTITDNIFPKVTPEFISLSVSQIEETQGLAISNTLDGFLQEVTEESLKSEKLQELLSLIRMLSDIDSEMALSASYLTGVAIGLFLAKPELMSVVKEEEIEK